MYLFGFKKIIGKKILIRNSFTPKDCRYKKYFGSKVSSFRPVVTLPSGTFWLGVLLLAGVVVLITGGKQSQLQVSILTLKFDKNSNNTKNPPEKRVLQI